ncbi:ATP-grasp domain-containing protein [Kitasatospora sp. NPDC052896]|uniref:ATP-grasp domain-containing protein n=1 Tax=Kitasatospora sp. NPDC052896 TaxID=3364061 RepID=UPI0037CB428E
MNTPSGRNVIALEWLQFGLGRLVAAAAAEGLTVHLLTCDRSEYLYELAMLDTAHLAVHDVNTHDVAEVVDKVREIGDVAGLVSTTDTWSLVSLAVREELGLAGQDPACVRLVRDKEQLRRRLYEHGLSRADGCSIGPVDDAAGVAARVGLPLVVKDSAGTGSKHVWLARTLDELTTVLHTARRSTLRGRLAAEPYVLGPLYSIETLTWEGRTRVIGVSSRVLSAPPVFREEALGFPVALPAAMAEDAERWIEQVLKAVGYTEGFAHTEFILTDGGFEVVEINPRLGGALIGEEISRTLDADPYAAFVDLVLRRRPALMDAPLTPRHGAAHARLYAPHPGVFLGISGRDALTGHPGDPVLYPALAAGTTVRTVSHQDGCVALLFATGATAELALQNVLSAAGELRIRMKDDDGRD